MEREEIEKEEEREESGKSYYCSPQSAVHILQKSTADIATATIICFQDYRLPDVDYTWTEN